ncbi:MAG: LysM peptidoglycan-binding domain-containing protein, partial [Chloroflexota bacterium]
SPTTIAIQPTPTSADNNSDESQSTPDTPNTPIPPTLTPVPTQEPTATPVTSIENPNSGSTNDFVTHTVQRGENLYRIGRTYGISVDELVRINGLTNPNTIYVGQDLKIPSQSAGGDGIHIVQRGDTLLSISLRYGTTTAVLQQLNNLANPNVIYVGQKLKVP